MGMQSATDLDWITVEIIYYHTGKGLPVKDVMKAHEKWSIATCIEDFLQVHEGVKEKDIISVERKF